MLEGNTSFSTTTHCTFYQTIQFCTIKTGKRILSELPVPYWNCQLLPGGTRSWYRYQHIQSNAGCQLLSSICLRTISIWGPWTRVTKYALMNVTDSEARSQWAQQHSSPVVPHVFSLTAQGDEYFPWVQRILHHRLCCALICTFFGNISGGRTVTPTLLPCSPPKHLSLTANTNYKTTRSNRGDLKEAEPHKLCGKGCLSFSLTDGMPSLFYSIYNKICLFWYPLYIVREKAKEKLQEVYIFWWDSLILNFLSSPICCTRNVIYKRIWEWNWMS